MGIECPLLASIGVIKNGQMCSRRHALTRRHHQGEIIALDDLENPVVVEMKFNGAFPLWMQQVSESLELRRVSCSKYAQGVELVGDLPWSLGA